MSPLRNSLRKTKKESKSLKLLAHWASPHSLLLERFLETEVSPKRITIYTTVPPLGFGFNS